MAEMERRSAERLRPSSRRTVLLGRKKDEVGVAGMEKRVLTNYVNPMPRRQMALLDRSRRAASYANVVNELGL
jgi:hypothetical protein